MSNQKEKKPVATIILVSVTIMVYLIGIFGGAFLYEHGWLDRDRVLIYHEYGRLAWAMFLHEGIDHLFNNMVILFFLGAMLEKEVGHIPLAMIYLLSGIGGNLLSLWGKVHDNISVPSLGASGAVFGLDGLLLALVLFSCVFRRTVSLRRVLLMIALSLYDGFAMDNVDNYAHVGGVITGFLLGSLFVFLKKWFGQSKYEVEV